MKKILLLVALVSPAFFAEAQSTSYHNFKIDFTSGYAIPTGNRGGIIENGPSFTVEPHYRLSDELAAGLRFEGALLFYNNSDNNSDVKVALLNSVCATANYYFTNGGIRPFGGIGLGSFTRQAIDLSYLLSANNTIKLPATTSFGFFPALGVESGHFRASAEYNILGNNSSYLSFKIGFFVGGGRK